MKTFLKLILEIIIKACFIITISSFTKNDSRSSDAAETEVYSTNDTCTNFSCIII